LYSTAVLKLVSSCVVPKFTWWLPGLFETCADKC